MRRKDATNPTKEAIVHRNPHMMNGALVFAGTRVPVKILMDHLAAGDSLDEFLEGFPGVSREQAVTYLEMAPRGRRGCFWGRQSPAVAIFGHRGRQRR